LYPLILSLHILVCVLVVFIVLIQSGKGAGLSGLLGGGGGDALFSAPSGSAFLRKVTTGLATGFLLTCLVLTYLTARKGMRTVTRGAWPQAPQSAPAMPAPAPEAPPK
jgi:preprotein translocase subunit SecG